MTNSASSDNSTFDLSQYEVKETVVDPDSLRVTGSKLYHKQFTTEESIAMEKEKSVKRPLDNPSSSSTEQKKPKKAVPLSEVDANDFTFRDIYTASNTGNKSRSIDYKHGLITSPWLFTSFAPKNWSKTTDKENWSFTGTFIGVDDTWNLGDEIPEESRITKTGGENKDGIERHIAYGKTKEMDKVFIQDVVANSEKIYGSKLSSTIIGNKYGPVAKLNTNIEGKHFSPSLSGSIRDSQIPVFRVSKTDEPLPPAPNSSVVEFSKMDKGKYFVKYLLELNKQKYAKSQLKNLVDYDWVCHGIVFVELGKSGGSTNPQLNNIGF